MDPLNLSMFRAYDIRTPSALLTPELAVRLAQAEAVYFREDLEVETVVVAHDARSTGPMYLEIGVEQYLSAGLNVLLIPGVCSTSMFYFAAMNHPEAAAVMFGASHNPAGDTGRKTLGPGVRPIAWGIGPHGGLMRLKELYTAGEKTTAQRRGRVWAWDPLTEYTAYSMHLAQVEPGSLRGTRILHDYLHGAAGREMTTAFTQAGAELIPQHFCADGRFPLGDPNPVKPEVISQGVAALKQEACLLGTFFDGDGDRIDFYRGDGAYLASSFVYAGILPEIRARFSESGLAVYADLKCNPLAVIEMAKTGLGVKVIRNGHSQIKDAMYQDPAMIGTVEESAHFYEAFSHKGLRFCTENTLYIALLTAATWRQNPERFNTLLQLQAATSREREWGYKFPTDQHRAEALAAVQSHFEAQGAKSMTQMPNGMDLEATMMRLGLPFEMDAGTSVSEDWLQVCQRISQSENGLARWEVVAAEPKDTAQAVHDIETIVQKFGAGERYRG